MVFFFIAHPIVFSTRKWNDFYVNNTPARPIACEWEDDVLWKHSAARARALSFWSAQSSALSTGETRSLTWEKLELFIYVLRSNMCSVCVALRCICCSSKEICYDPMFYLYERAPIIDMEKIQNMKNRWRVEVKWNGRETLTFVFRMTSQHPPEAAHFRIVSGSSSLVTEDVEFLRLLTREQHHTMIETAKLWNWNTSLICSVFGFSLTRLCSNLTPTLTHDKWKTNFSQFSPFPLIARTNIRCSPAQTCVRKSDMHIAKKYRVKINSGKVTVERKVFWCARKIIKFSCY